MKSLSIYSAVLAAAFSFIATGLLSAESDRYDKDKSFIEGQTYEEGFRREMYVQFKPDSPIKGCRRSGGGGGG